MPRLNIELAHIYADRHQIEQEQIESIDKLKGLLEEGQIDRTDAVFCVWIDDYNPLKCNLDLERFVAYVHGLTKIHYVCSEGLVAREYDNFRKYLDQKDMEYYDDYLLKHGKLPCSLVTAMWYLMRLNNDFHYETVILQRLSDSSFKAENIINILPKKFANAELSALKIFKENESLTNYLDRIKTIFY